MIVRLLCFLRHVFSSVKLLGCPRLATAGDTAPKEKLGYAGINPTACQSRLSSGCAETVPVPHTQAYEGRMIPSGAAAEVIAVYTDYGISRSLTSKVNTTANTEGTNATRNIN